MQIKKRIAHKSNMDIPKSLKALSAYQSAYQQQLRKLPYYNMVAPVIEDFLQKIVQRGAFYTRTPVSALGGILSSKRIKSVMETGTSSTNGGAQTRKEVTEALFGCRADKLLPAEYPKYGFLSQANAVRDLFVNSQMWSQYGDVSIQLNKESLMHRTTLCVGNSVNFGRCFTMIPTRVDDIKATCLSGLAHNGKPLMSMPDPLLCYIIFASLVLEHKLTLDNFPELESIAVNAPPMFEFFELQYHGEIDITRDVERIDVVPSTQEERAELEIFKQKFESIGVKFFISEGL